MRNIFTGIIAIAVILCSAPAYSAGPYYVGGNYSLVTEEVTTLGAPNDFEIGTLSVNGGAYFSKFFAVEGRVGIGVQDDTSLPRTADIDYLVGAYVRGVYPLGIFEPYLVAGFTLLEMTWTGGGEGTVTEDGTDFSYGIGADFKINDKFAINLEYMYLMESDFFYWSPRDVDSLSLGVKYYF